jgi:hypothetical protein
MPKGQYDRSKFKSKKLGTETPTSATKPTKRGYVMTGRKSDITSGAGQEAIALAHELVTRYGTIGTRFFIKDFEVFLHKRHRNK